MKYWAYINDEVLGPFEPEKLRGLARFTSATLICPETAVGGQQAGWKEAAGFPEVMAAMVEGTTRPSNPMTAPQQKPMTEPPLALTMRGSLINESAVADPLAAAPPSRSGRYRPAAEPQQPPAASPAPSPAPAREEPLAMTMRGTIIEMQPVAQSPAPAAQQPAPAPARAPEPAPQPAPVHDMTSAMAHTEAPPPAAAPAPAPAPAPAAAPVPAAAPAAGAPSQEQLRQKVEDLGALLTSMKESQSMMLERLRRLESVMAAIKGLLQPPRKD